MGKKVKSLKDYRSKKKDPSLIRNRATRSGGLTDPMFKEDVSVYKPKDGTNKLRILPGGDYWGLEAHMHWIEVEGKGRPYLCPAKMEKTDCPICEESKKAYADDDEEYGRELRAKQRLFVWAIDRDKPEDGPIIWDLPHGMEVDLNASALDEDTDEVLAIDDPVEGYDVIFTKEGKGLTTKYTGVKIARRETPLSDDEGEAIEWLEYVEENPLEEVINVYSYNNIKAAFEGKPVESTSSKKKKKKAEPVDDQEEEEEDPPWESEEEEDEDDADEMESDEEEEEDDDEEEEEEPPASRLRARMQKRRKARG